MFHVLLLSGSMGNQRPSFYFGLLPLYRSRERNPFGANDKIFLRIFNEFQKQFFQVDNWKVGCNSMTQQAKSYICRRCTIAFFRIMLLKNLPFFCLFGNSHLQESIIHGFTYRIFNPFAFPQLVLMSESHQSRTLTGEI